MLFISSITLLILTFILLYNYNLYLKYLTKNLEETHLRITLFSFITVISYLIISVLISENLNTNGCSIDLIEIYYFFVERLFKQFKNTFITTKGFYVFFLLSLMSLLLLNFYLTLLFIHKYIKISFRRFYYLLLNNGTYRYYRSLQDLIYMKLAASEKNKMYSIFDKEKVIFYFFSLFFRILFFLPLILIILSVIYDCFYNNYILEKYFYICCCLPIYYLIINILNFLTENSLQRADDIVVYAAIYCKDSMYITKEIKDELVKYQYQKNITDAFGAQELKNSYMFSLVKEDYMAYQKYKTIEKTITDFFD